jgi:hypothetical protein
MEKMTYSEVIATKPKRGPKPLGEQTMTPAERQRKRREKKGQEGSAEFMVTLARGKLAFIDQLAKAGNTTRSATVGLLLDTAIHNVALAVAEATRAQEAGVPDEDVANLLQAALGASLPPTIIPRYKEVLGID